MKGILLIVALLCVCGSLAEQSRRNLPEIETLVPECHQGQLGWLWPNFEDGTRFYQCGAVGWVLSMPCAPGTWFGFELQVCVHPHQWVSPEPPTSPEPETETETTTTKPTRPTLPSWWPTLPPWWPTAKPTPPPWWPSHPRPKPTTENVTNPPPSIPQVPTRTPTPQTPPPTPPPAPRTVV